MPSAVTRPEVCFCDLSVVWQYILQKHPDPLKLGSRETQHARVMDHSKPPGSTALHRAHVCLYVVTRAHLSIR